MTQPSRFPALLILGTMLTMPMTYGAAQPAVQPQKAPAPRAGEPAVPGAVAPPAGYVIGPDDVLGIVFWREKDLSADVVVRPDGMISLPLLDEISVAGLTPAELREKVMVEANKFVEDANATVVVKQINSRRVFITGSVAKPGAYPLTGSMTVVQLVALAGGLLEFAEGTKIRVMRMEKGAPVALPLNYKTFSEGKNLRQNIELKPGDTVIVP